MEWPCGQLDLCLSFKGFLDLISYSLWVLEQLEFFNLQYPKFLVSPYSFYFWLHQLILLLISSLSCNTFSNAANRIQHSVTLRLFLITPPAPPSCWADHSSVKPQSARVITGSSFTFCHYFMFWHPPSTSNGTAPHSTTTTNTLITTTNKGFVTEAPSLTSIR